MLTLSAYPDLRPFQLWILLSACCGAALSFFRLDRGTLGTSRKKDGKFKAFGKLDRPLRFLVLTVAFRHVGAMVPNSAVERERASRCAGSLELGIWLLLGWLMNHIFPSSSPSSTSAFESTDGLPNMGLGHRSCYLWFDMGWTIKDRGNPHGKEGPWTKFLLTRIQLPKTRGRSAKHQSARVDPHDAVFGSLPADAKLWPFSAQTLRDRFSQALAALHLPTVRSGGQRPFDLGSLRPGGATFPLNQTEDSELCRRRGRWISIRSWKYICKKFWLQPTCNVFDQMSVTGYLSLLLLFQVL